MPRTRVEERAKAVAQILKTFKDKPVNRTSKPFERFLLMAFHGGQYTKTFICSTTAAFAFKRQSNLQGIRAMMPISLRLKAISIDYNGSIGKTGRPYMMIMIEQLPGLMAVRCEMSDTSDFVWSFKQKEFISTFGSPLVFLVDEEQNFVAGALRMPNTKREILRTPH